jgi:transcriptional regulator with GAF, ATPase, and Fis domain
MIGESEAINHIKVMIEKVAQTEARVLITGPNGTEKNGCPSITRKSDALISFNRSKLCCHSIRIDRK